MLLSADTYHRFIITNIAANWSYLWNLTISDSICTRIHMDSVRVETPTLSLEYLWLACNKCSLAFYYYYFLTLAW